MISFITLGQVAFYTIAAVAFVVGGTLHFKYYRNRAEQVSIHTATGARPMHKSRLKPDLDVPEEHKEVVSDPVPVPPVPSYMNNGIRPGDLTKTTKTYW